MVENNSTTAEIKEYYEELSRHPKIRIVTYAGEFNYSRINNFGAGFAQGEYLLL